MAQQDEQTPETLSTHCCHGEERDLKAALVVLGNGGEHHSSGDQVSDEAGRRRPVTSHEAMNVITMKGDSKAILVIGDDDYPSRSRCAQQERHTVVRYGAGRREILYRRTAATNSTRSRPVRLCRRAERRRQHGSHRSRGRRRCATLISAPARRTGCIGRPRRARRRRPAGELFAEARARAYRAAKAARRITSDDYKILPGRGQPQRAGQPTTPWTAR